MRLVLDTNVLVSALAHGQGAPAALLDAWRLSRRYVLVTSELQLREVGSVTRRPELRRYFPPATAGRLVNQLRHLAELHDSLPVVDRSRDPADNFLLAMVEAGEADYLVTGDKRDLLVLGQHGRTRIVTVRQMLEILERS